MTGSAELAAGSGLSVETEDERTRAAKVEAAQGLSSIVSRAADFPSTIGFEEISDGQAARARSNTILDLPAASRPKRKPFTERNIGRGTNPSD